MEKDGRTQSEKVRFKRRQLLHFKGYDEVASETSEIKEKRSCMTGGLSSLMEKQLQNVLRRANFLYCRVRKTTNESREQGHEWGVEVEMKSESWKITRLYRFCGPV